MEPGSKAPGWSTPSSDRRTSAFSITGRGLDIREIGSRLNVDAVIEGSLRKAGDRIRISAQLIEVTSGHTLWSGRFAEILAKMSCKTEGGD